MAFTCLGFPTTLNLPASAPHHQRFTLSYPIIFICFYHASQSPPHARHSATCYVLRRSPQCMLNGLYPYAWIYNITSRYLVRKTLPRGQDSSAERRRGSGEQMENPFVIWPYRSGHRDNFPALVVGQMSLQVNICRDRDRRWTENGGRRGGGGVGAPSRAKQFPRKMSPALGQAGGSGRRSRGARPAIVCLPCPLPIVFTPRTKAPLCEVLRLDK